MSKILSVLTIAIFVSQSPRCFADIYEELSREVEYPASTMNSGTLKAISDLDDGSPEVNCLLGYVAGNNDCNQAATVKALLNKGATPLESDSRVNRKPGLFSKGFTCERGKDLSRAIHSGCSNIVELIVEKMDPTEIDRGISSSSDLFSPPLNKGPAESQRDEKNRALVSGVIGTLKRRCENDGPASGTCAQVKKTESKENTYIADQKQKADAAIAARADSEKHLRDAEREAAEAESSPAGLQNRACEAYGNIKRADQQLAHEHEVGKESGYVNKAALHELGQMKVYAKHDLEKRKAEYKKRTGTQLDLGKCKADRNTASE